MEFYEVYDPAKKYEIKKGQVGIVWLGQAGFMFIDSRGYKIVLDAYMTNSCERIVNFKRLTPPPFAAEDIDCDLMLISHNHPDHYDMDFVPELMKRNKKTKLFAAPTAADDCARDGVDMSRVTRVNRGDSFTVDGIKFRGVFSDHGDMTPDALGFVIDFGGITVYTCGDTCYNVEKLLEAVPEHPDVMIPPINGAFGNLNSREAAQLAIKMQAKMVIPCHFWTFKEHFGNPQELTEAAKELGIEDKIRFMTAGEIIICG